MFKKKVFKSDNSTYPNIIRPSSSLNSDSLNKPSDSSTKEKPSTPRKSPLSPKSSSMGFSLKTITSKFLLNIEDFEPFNKKSISGGCGIVNFVRNKKSGKKYAAKTSYQAMNTNDNKYVLRELNILMKIQHPTIIHFEGYSLQDMQGNDGITLFTDFMENGTLADIIDNGRRGFLPHEFDNTKRQIILVGIARGMMILHKNNVINRDLKPQNILIDKDFKPLITDFGLSKFFNAQGSLNQTAGTIGTYAYMAPEVIDGNNFNTKADVYAFGILMYEFITGSNAINNIMHNKEFNEFAFFKRILDGERPKFDPRQRTKPGFRKIIEQCWSKDPDERPTFSEIYSKLSLSDDKFYVDFDNNICESIIKCEDEDEDEKESMLKNYCYNNVDFDELFQYINEISETTKDSKDEEIEMLKQKVDQINKCNQKMQNEIDELKNEMLKQKVDQLNKFNQKMQNEIDELKNEMRKQKVDLLNECNKKMQNEIDELKNEMRKQKVDQLNKFNQKMQNEIDELKNEMRKQTVDQINECNKKMQNEIDELKNENSKMKNENQKLKDKVSQMTDDITELKKIVLQLQNKMKKEDNDKEKSENKETEKYDTKTKQKEEVDQLQSKAAKSDTLNIVKIGLKAPQKETISNVNLLSYANGARVTYVSAVPYNTKEIFLLSVNGGYTGNCSPLNSSLLHSEDNFWGAYNGWNAQGALENDDDKNNINLTHDKSRKRKTSSTTVTVRNSDTTVIIIINPRAYNGDINRHIFKMTECYLASANSDGNVGDYKIYVSKKNDISVATNPNDSSWTFVTEGTLTTDAELTKVYNGSVNFRFIKLALNNRDKPYMELAAIKIYGCSI